VVFAAFLHTSECTSLLTSAWETLVSPTGCVYARNVKKTAELGIEISEGNNAEKCRMFEDVLQATKTRFFSLEHRFSGRKKGIATFSRKLQHDFLSEMAKIEDYTRKHGGKRKTLHSFDLLRDEMKQALVIADEMVESKMASVPDADPSVFFFFKIFSGSGIMSWAFDKCQQYHNDVADCHPNEPFIRLGRKLKRRLFDPESKHRLSPSNLKTLHWGFQRFLKLRSSWSKQQFLDKPTDPFTSLSLLRPCDFKYTDAKLVSKCENMLVKLAEMSDPGEGMPMVRQIVFGLNYPTLCTSTAFGGCCPGVESSVCMELHGFLDWNVKTFDKRICINKVKECLDVGVYLPREITAGWVPGSNDSDFPDMCREEIPDVEQMAAMRAVRMNR